MEEERDCLGCWYFLPFKNEIIDMKLIDEGYCLNEKSKYYCDKVVGKEVICGFWSDTPPEGEGNDEY